MAVQGDPTTTPPAPGANCSVIAGVLSSPPTARTLPSGDRLVTLEVTVRRPGEVTDTVPVAWPAGAESCLRWPPGEPVVVVGRVRRRFFRAAGSTGSRTEVVAATVVRRRRAAAASRAVARALHELEPLLEHAGAR